MTERTQIDPSVNSALATASIFSEAGSPLTNLFRADTWRAFGYHCAMLVLALVGFVYVVTAVSVGASLGILVVGLVVFAALILGARGIGAAYRAVTNGLLGTSIPAPLPPRRREGVVGFTKMGLTDTASWRAMAHSLASFITSLLSFIVTTTLLMIGLGGTTYAVWRPFLPQQEASDGSLHRGTELWTDFYIDTPPRMLLFAAFGLLTLIFAWPAANNGLARLQAYLAASLLGPTEASLTQARLESQRDQTAAATTDKMRSIERDLHDVTQAQLVAIAMKLGDVRDRLESGESADAILTSIAAAHDTSKDALTDLRALVRGIHPAALDAGLGTALQTLASRSALPVALSLAVTHEVAAPVETVAYYCAAELLNNAAKHSGAPTVALTVSTDDDHLILTAQDQGRGGAHGLASVRERAGSVGGSVTIDSPAGGPTVVIVTLPRTLAS